MKIGIYDPYLDDLGGGEKYMMTLAECLSENNDVTVFWNNNKDLENVSARFALDLSTVKVEKNIFSKDVSSAERILEARKYDAVVLLSDGSVPLIFTKLFVHFQQPVLKPPLKERLKIMWASKVFCNSLFTKSYIDNSYGVKSIVLYPPVDTNKNNTQKENIILHVGRFRQIEKGDFKKQQFMVESFKKMHGKGLRGWRLIIAASLNDPGNKQFEKMTKEAKRFPIEILVNRKSDDLSILYSKAKIYWHASGYGENLEKNPELAEHFGISTAEAMSAGAVPVVINAGGQKELVENGANGYLWETESELIRKTLDLIRDEKLLEKMSVEARKIKNKFNKQKFCREVINLIQ